MENFESGNLETQKGVLEWSKWLVAINFSAATGCIIDFKINPEDATKPHLKWAIAIFALNVVFSVIIAFLFAMRAKPSLIPSVQWFLGGLQFLLFCSGLYHLFCWLKFI